MSTSGRLSAMSSARSSFNRSHSSRAFATVPKGAVLAFNQYMTGLLAPGSSKLGMVRDCACKGAGFCSEADDAKRDTDGSGEEDEGEGEPLEVEAGVPLLPWNILVTWPPGDLSLLFRTTPA